MSTLTKFVEDSCHLPELRTNKHFRIKSSSREKLVLGGEIMTVKSKRKGSIDETKRIFSETKHKKSGIFEQGIKVRIIR